MKKTLLLLFSSLFISNILFSQNAVCGSYKGYIQDDIQKFPDFYESISEKNIQLEEAYKQAQSSIVNTKSSDRKIIPVVVHVIHDNGAENISDDVVKQAIHVLNKNINGQSDLFLSRTPDVFAALRGEPNLEFRLATIDPDGNPTTGINRVQSSLTNEPNPRNSVKALSYWNSYQYFNIWVIKKFLPEDNGNTLLGFAQFPFSGSMATDGVVLIYNEFNDPTSSTLTHETGHWLGLCHPWDCGGGTCGDDNIIDTPPSREANYAASFSQFPYHVGLQNQGCVADSLNWAGEMFMNYMDYTPDQYTTMFSKGQVDVMNETLEGAAGVPGFRTYMWQEDNISQTLLDPSNGVETCTKQVDIFENSGQYTICDGEDTWFKSNSKIFGANNITLTEWDLGDGTITAGDYQSQLGYYYLHEYDNPGSYDVSFTVTYDETVSVDLPYKIHNGLSIPYSALSAIFPGADYIDSTFNTIIVQGTEFELLSAANIDPATISEHQIDSLGIYWNMVDTSFFRAEAEEITYTAHYINICTSTVLKQDFIIVSPTSSSNTPSDSYSFEDIDDLEDEWRVVANDESSDWSYNIEDASNWEWSNLAADAGDASLMIDTRDNFSSGKTVLVSDAFDLTGFNSPAIKFSWAGAALNTFPSNELKVFYSTNCGKTWSTLGTIGAIDAARSGYYADAFIPTSSDWNDTVMTKPALVNDNVRFKFEYLTDSRTNRFYLDNIRIGDAASLFSNPSENVTRLSIHPNPTSSSSILTLSNLQEKYVQVKLINVLGKEVVTLYSGKLNTDIYVIETGNLDYLRKGIYFINVISDGDFILTDKLILK